MSARTYLITGASGIGAETARQLAARGANIFLAAKVEAECAKLAEQLRELGGNCEFYSGDLTDPQTAPAAARLCVEKFGGVDGLYNVAGISGRKFGDGPIHKCTEDGWSLTLAANATTHYRMCREVVRIMLSQAPRENGQRGIILNMASILGLHPEPNHFDTHAYAASKGAIMALTRSMAAAYAREKIRVNAIAPALVHTPMSARATQDAAVMEFNKHKQPLTDGVIPVEDVARASVFLLTDDSRAITGKILEVDAGWNLC